MNPPPFLWPRTKTEPMWTPCPSPWAVLRNLLPPPCSLKARLFYESRIIGLGASIDALKKNGNAEWITPKYPPPPLPASRKRQPWTRPSWRPMWQSSPAHSRLIPVGFSTAATAAYEKILEASQFWHSFLISVERVVLALIINFVLIVLMAYPLSKTNAQFRGRNIYANLMIFAMLFNGGMIPTFLVVKSYGLLNTVWALVLPGAVPIFVVGSVKG